MKRQENPFNRLFRWVTHSVSAISEFPARPTITSGRFVGAFTDGRDTPPSVGYLTDLVYHMGKSTGRLASVVGRAYAMDRTTAGSDGGL